MMVEENRRAIESLSLSFERLAARAKAGKICELEGVREYTDRSPVELWRDEETGRLVIRAYNEVGYSGTDVDLCDFLAWLSSRAGDVVVLDNQVREALTALSARGDLKRHQGRN
jgi:hypothetical protein